MAKNAYAEKVRALNEKYPGLRKDLDTAISQGHNAHYISGRMQLMHGVRLKESFVERYVNYRKIWGAVEDDDPMEPTENPASDVTGDAQGNEGASGQGAPDEPGGRKRKARSKTSEYKKEVTKADIIAVLKEKVAGMLHRAKADPSSDATPIIRILLLNEMTNEALGFREEDYAKLIEAERKRADLQNKFEHEKFLRRQDARKWQLQKDKLRETMETAWDAEAQGRSMSHQEIFKQISAVIGVGQPQIEPAEPQGA